MKTKLIFFGMLCFNLSFGQQSQSLNSVFPSITPVPLGVQAAPNEIFRFQPGNVTQLDTPLAQGFNFTTARWFSLGKVEVPAGQTFYGSRFQTPNNALVMGYTSLSPNNPRIEWISTDIGSRLEFRVGTGFGSPGSPGASTFVASMNSVGTTTFGDKNIKGIGPRVVIVSTRDELAIDNTGLQVSAVAAESVIGINAGGNSGSLSSVGVLGFASPSLTSLGFATGIFGRTISYNNDQWAGFFDGKLFASSITTASDQKLKTEITQEKPVLDLLMQLKPVTYKFIESKEINLPRKLQHGFIAQDIEKVFPELVTDISKPIFDDEGKIISTFNFKALEYSGMTSMLVAAIQELHQELKTLKAQLAVLRSDKAATQFNNTETGNTGVFMKQNIPNPFTESTTIRYQLPEGTTTADIMVFDFNGKPIKTFPINKNESEITISAAEIGKGLFIYSLVQNGQELVTKKMIVN